MPNQRNAFLPGERVMIADEPTMQAALIKYRNREEVIAALRPHIGEHIRIIDYSFPHVSGALYKLKGIDQEIWEECLIDGQIDPDDPHFVAAIDCYEIGLEADDGEQYVVIRDKSGKLFSKTWNANPKLAVEEITAMATMRTRLAFEYFYGFSGNHNNERG